MSGALRGNTEDGEVIRDLTIGQYYPTDSVLHRLDPRVKLFATLAYLVSLFCFRNMAGLAAVTACLILIVRLSRVPFRYMVRGMRGIAVILAMTAAFHLFLTPGEPLVSFWKLTVTKEGARNAFFLSARLAYMVLGSSVLTLTTTPNQLADGMEKALRPLAKLRVPVHEIAMMMSIALRFIPILTEEMERIRMAQLARGADLESRNLRKKAKAMLPLLVPLFVSAFRRADDLALAMESRCYRGGGGRTKMYPLRYQRRDYLAYLAVAGYLAVTFLLR